MNHTPGPWKAVKYQDVKSVTIHAGGLSIGRMARVEDAVLAAAAPELIAALKRRRCVVCSYLIGDELPGPRCHGCCDARAVIAKAEGKV